MHSILILHSHPSTCIHACYVLYLYVGDCNIYNTGKVAVYIVTKTSELL